ncbi:MAG TPA: HD domain-containing protein [Chromobacteriaceae bacterium]|nr:HD domain-containing protein [Chromobacteriaceae bacterium]
MTASFASLQQHISFIIEIDKLKGVLRKNKPVTIERYENSAEHSWQVALLALTMQPFASEPIAIDRVIQLLLVHDIGEIDAGDVIVYAEGNAAEREAEERAAVERIAGLLPAPLYETIVTLWQEFEDRQTPEARYAHAMDRLMPILLNLHRQGQSWRENSVRKEQVLTTSVSKVIAACPDAGLWLQHELERAEQAGYFG